MLWYYVVNKPHWNIVAKGLLYYSLLLITNKRLLYLLLLRNRMHSPIIKIIKYFWQLLRNRRYYLQLVCNLFKSTNIWEEHVTPFLHGWRISWTRRRQHETGWQGQLDCPPCSLKVSVYFLQTMQESLTVPHVPWKCRFTVCRLCRTAWLSPIDGGNMFPESVGLLSADYAGQLDCPP
jgi:hypothetical protein